jgi:hypothetical protein
MSLRDLFERSEDDRDVGIPGSDDAEPARAPAQDATPQLFLHRLRAPAAGAADALAAILRNYGYETEVQASLDPGSWLVNARKEMPADEAHLAEADALFRELAAEHGAEYDGRQPSAAG